MEQFKICPSCEQPIVVTAILCECGEMFLPPKSTTEGSGEDSEEGGGGSVVTIAVDITDAPSTAGILDDVACNITTVRQVKYSIHRKAKPTRESVSLKIEYLTPVGTFFKYLFFSPDNHKWAVGKCAEWWSHCAIDGSDPTAIPSSEHDALRRASSGDLSDPTHLKFSREGKYTNVTDIKVNERWMKP